MTGLAFFDMSAAKIGRNDRCPCGSGRKYKHCHWQQDQARPPVPVSEAPAAAALPPPPLDLAELRRQLPSMSQLIPKADRAELTGLIDTFELLADYELHHEAIEAAHQALAPYHAEFTALLEDKTAALGRMRRLFGEETFAALRFRAADLRRAFAVVGYPGLLADQQTRATLRQAVLFLADDACRRRFATRLLLLLPDLVASSRHLDACLVECCAMRTSEEIGESNPFLFEMFQFGFAEWEDQRRARDGEVLRRMGLDVEQIHGLPPEELAARMQELLKDPERTRQMKSFVKANPEARAVLEAECRSADALAIAWMDREDARPLLPALSETVPWLQMLEQRFMATDAGAALQRGDPPTNVTWEALGELLWEVAGEMATELFTPARVAQLGTQLREFVVQHRHAADPEGRDHAEAALLVLARGRATADDPFLTSICYTALRNTLRTADTPPAEDPAT